MALFQKMAQPTVKKWLAEVLAKDAVWIKKLEDAVMEASK
jgi:GTP-dependent phosphoenolpyruvate carboxykinase